MNKTTVDKLKKINVSFLKEQKLLKGDKSAEMSWSVGDQIVGRVGFEVSISGAYLRLFYTITAQNSGRSDFDYKVPLVTTPCYFGGHRYWFRCPLSNKGVYCGKRVGILYLGKDLFGCRHCYGLTYACRNQGGTAKSPGKALNQSELKIVRDKMRSTTYRGKPTKRFIRYLKKDYKADEYYCGMIMSFNDKIEKIMEKEKPRKAKSKL